MATTVSTSLNDAMAQLAASGDAPELSSLPASKLGTKQHWDEVYAREVNMFKEIGDEGEVWFGEDSADKMVQWAEQHFSDTSASMLDVGTGNGQLLFALAEAGYTSLTGLDYSAPSIELAESISASRTNLKHKPTFVVGDILSSSPIDGVTPRRRRRPRGGEASGDDDDDDADEEGWKLIMDKGTYDAVCLSDEERDGKRVGRLYPVAVANLLAPGGIFLITSCNWTRTELERAFITTETGLEFHSHVPRPKFSFGGGSGSSIETVAFVKRS